MLTRIEIDGFKTFENFSLDLRPFTAVVGPNASGKSNLFDALKLLSCLVQNDIRTAMSKIRGLPEEIFRKTSVNQSEIMSFAVEVILQRNGIDDFGRSYNIVSQRVRYELKIRLHRDSEGQPHAVYVIHEQCSALPKRGEKADYIKSLNLMYSANSNPYIRTYVERNAIEVRQDGPYRHGKPVTLPLSTATRTALSTISTSEFPHLYALKKALSGFKFLEINPASARSSNDRLEEGNLRADASNLASALFKIKSETETLDRPEGVISDITSALTSLIPSVKAVQVVNDHSQRRIEFSLKFSDNQEFSSRVISDGTLRLLALLTVLNDPIRQGTLCFEEPENGVHEGRIGQLVEIMRLSTEMSTDKSAIPFQILINTHSPRLLRELRDNEVVVADIVGYLDKDSESKVTKTRMRVGLNQDQDLFDPERHISRSEVHRILQNGSDAA